MLRSYLGSADIHFRQTRTDIWNMCRRTNILSLSLQTKKRNDTYWKVDLHLKTWNLRNCIAPETFNDLLRQKEVNQTQPRQQQQQQQRRQTVSGPHHQQQHQHQQSEQQPQVVLRKSWILFGPSNGLEMYVFSGSKKQTPPTFIPASQLRVI